MGYSRQDLGLDVPVDVGPWLRVHGGRRGEERTEVARFDVCDDTVVGDIFLVISDYRERYRLVNEHEGLRRAFVYVGLGL